MVDELGSQDAAEVRQGGCAGISWLGKVSGCPDGTGTCHHFAETDLSYQESRR